MGHSHRRRAAYSLVGTYSRAIQGSARYYPFRIRSRIILSGSIGGRWRLGSFRGPRSSQ